MSLSSKLNFRFLSPAFTSLVSQLITLSSVIPANIFSMWSLSESEIVILLTLKGASFMSLKELGLPSPVDGEFVALRVGSEIIGFIMFV